MICPIQHVNSFNADVNAHDGPNSFWLVNDSLFIASIIPFLQEIRKFAVVSGEVIIVDFSNFPLGRLRFVQVGQ